MDNTFDKLFYEDGELIGGIDESGVTDIAGPLIAACVVLPKTRGLPADVRLFEVEDSKDVSEYRLRPRAEIIWNNAIAIGIGEVQPSEIDVVGGSRATRLAMLRAVHACKRLSDRKSLSPDLLLVDGKRDIPLSIPQVNIVEGDRKSLCIAAASIIAKVYRDDVMLALHARFPYYDWSSNKGYPSEKHLEGLDAHGIQIGVHRIRSWPFLRAPLMGGKSPPNDAAANKWAKRWSKRRDKWRDKTSLSLGLELGDSLWTTKPPSRLHSRDYRTSSTERQKTGRDSRKSRATSTSATTGETSL